MAWPFPVIGIASEFTYTFRRGSYQADVFVHFVYIHQVLVVFEHTVHPCSNPIVLIGNFIGNGFVYFLNFLYPVGPGQSFQSFFNLAGNILDSFEELNGKGCFQFFVFAGSIKTIPQIIVLNTAGCSNGAISAVVIGKNQPLVTHYLPGTSTSKNNDGIF